MSGDEIARPLSHMLAQAAHAPWELGDRSETPRPHSFNRAHQHSSRHPLASGSNQDGIMAYQQPAATAATTAMSSSSHAVHNSHQSHHHYTSSHAQASSSSSSTTTKPTASSSYIGPELYDSSPPSTPPSLEEEEAAFKEFKLEVRLQKIREFHAQACELELALARHLSGLGRREAADTDLPRKLVSEHKREMEALRASKEGERKAVVEAERERRRMSIRGRGDAHLGGAPSGSKAQQREPSVVHGGGKDLRKQIHAAQLAGQTPGAGGRRRTGSNASLSSVPAFLRNSAAENVNNNNPPSDDEQQQSEFEVWRPNAAPTSPPPPPVPTRPESRMRAPSMSAPPPSAATATTKKGKKKAAVTVEEVVDEDEELPSAMRQLQANAPVVRDHAPSLVPGRSNTPILQEIDASFLASPLPSSASMMMRNLPPVAQAQEATSSQQQWQSFPSPFQSSTSPFSGPLPSTTTAPSSKVRRPSLLSSSRVASSTATSTLASSVSASSASSKMPSPPVAAEASYSSDMRGSKPAKEEDEERSDEEESDKEDTSNDAAIAAAAAAAPADIDEPDDIFKQKLRAQIESSMKAEVKQVQTAHEESMRKAATSAQRRALETQHNNLMRQFSTAAQMQYEAALERERAERKLITGQDVGSVLTEAFVREQQSILEQLMRDRERSSSSSSPSSTSSSSSASPPLAASLSSPPGAAASASLPTPAPVPASTISAPALPLSTTTSSSSSVAVPITVRPGSRMSRASFSSRSHASVSASRSRTHLPLGFGASSESESEFDEPMLSSSVSSEHGGFGKHARWTPSAVFDSDTESVVDDKDAFFLHEQSGQEESSADAIAQMAAWAFQNQIASGSAGSASVMTTTTDKHQHHHQQQQQQQKQKHQAPPSTRTKHAHLLSSTSLSSPAPQSLATSALPPPSAPTARPSKTRRRGSFVGSQAGDGSLESWEVALKEALRTPSKSTY
jgi:hypothetical protein